MHHGRILKVRVQQSWRNLTAQPRDLLVHPHPVPHREAAVEARHGECLPLPQQSLFNRLPAFSRASAVSPGFTENHLTKEFSNLNEAKDK